MGHSRRRGSEVLQGGELAQAVQALEPVFDLLGEGARLEERWCRRALPRADRENHSSGCKAGTAALRAGDFREGLIGHW
jgi:hypothetical protein